MTPPRFSPDRAAGLDRLARFVPQAGRAYAARRNHDLEGHPHVSGLSPWIRHRLVTEAEVIAATLGKHSADAAEKFIQEVFWRSYWKGWLELRPGVWHDYRREVGHGLDRIATESGLRADWQAACRGETGIDAFDHWARELVDTGWLHNHARMWFASIWIFTLRLPWALGADFFLRHLLDGDPASNTLGWRWVAGIQTRGKIYLAQADNIARYTDGRFRPQGLARSAQPLDSPPPPAPRALPAAAGWHADRPAGLLLTEEDLTTGWLADRGLRPRAVATLACAAGRSALEVAPGVHAFTRGALEDATARQEAPGTACADPAAVVAWARAEGLAQIVTPWAPTGPAATALETLEAALAPHAIALVRARLGWDSRAWPHATHGFFRFRAQIPQLLRAADLAAA
ncbi:FAD-binding domain-containing protein [Rhodobaculum claviforme]|uniref:DNA photolyase n=1 Tax=Rhodobaculum claviforme TaxID=1549854 RepID=A0A934TL54_9RHOB|nr:FAD-binding domain-containing protein [Rhodobaculum claviforme]MBK5927835.1 DNA photolyase [Rhodobaculum claviforme]